MASTATGFGGMGTMMAIQGGKGIGSGAYGAAMSAQYSAAEHGEAISGIGMVKAAMGGGLAGGFGGFAQGLSNVGSHALRRAGAKDLAYTVRTGGTQLADRFQDVAYDHGRNVGLDLVGDRFADSSENMIHSFVSHVKVPSSEIQQYISQVPDLTRTIDGFAQHGDHHLIAEKFGYDGPNTSGVGRNIKNAVDSYRNNDEQMARISYMIDNGQFKTENLQKYASEGTKVFDVLNNLKSEHPGSLDKFMQ
jgi:hypothetical protein